MSVTGSPRNFLPDHCTGRPVYAFVRLSTVYMKQAESRRVVNKLNSENSISKLHLGLDIPLELNEAFIDSRVEFFSPNFFAAA